MNLNKKNPFPIYRKLLLENKILLFLGILFVLLGLFTLWAVHEAVSKQTIVFLTDQLRSEAFILNLDFSTSDQNKYSGALEYLMNRNKSLDYAIIQDSGKATIAHLKRTNLSPDPDSAQDAYYTHILSVTSLPSGYTLTVGISRKSIGKIAFRVMSDVIALVFIPVLLLLVASRLVVRNAMLPIKKLILVADEISTGNLHPIINFGERVNCWEIKNCARTDCNAFMNVQRQCWYIDGTPCEGYNPRFPEKLVGCRTCEVYQLHRGDEVVQLADAFRHMTNVLKESREDLIKSNDYQGRLIQNSFDGIIATDEKGVITIFNRVAESLIGFSQDQVIGTTHWDTFFRRGLENFMDKPLSYERSTRLRGFAPREDKVLSADGAWVNVRLAGLTLYKKGRHLGKVFLFQDMREINKLREDLIRSERLAATGQAAAGISHSIKNILDGLRGGAYIFKAGKGNSDEQKMELGFEMIERNVEIISNLVKDLLNFAKDRPPVYSPQNGKTLLEQVAVDVGTDNNRHISIKVVAEEPDRIVWFDYHSFHQCLANLVRNAMEAVLEVDDPQVETGFYFEDNNTVFYVKDNGNGMDKRTLEKVKGGMYSTKGSKGTGLGLLVVQKIVNEHKGNLEIETSPGAGALFRITLPIDGSPDSG